MAQTDNDKVKSGESRTRLGEILGILAKHKVVQGLSPEKLRHVLEDLGPTYIKLGQVMSMRSDILPAEYCAELVLLRSEVKPMDFADVRAVIEESCQTKLENIFSSFEEQPLGSASIAQAHMAKLLKGGRVVVKVQRKGIYEKMSEDIKLLHKASGIMKIVGGVGNVIDFNMLLDEMWAVALEEMDFLNEAGNIKDFHEFNRNTAYIGCPVVYEKYTTSKVLVMEYIDGFDIDQKDELVKNGYDLDEIAGKLAENYIKQIIDDGFFHADPHPANIRIRAGKIVWIDLGMMGRLSKRDRVLFDRALEAVAKRDVNTIKDVILSLGECKGKINHEALYSDIDELLNQYGNMDFAKIDMAEAMEDLLTLAKNHSISMPHGVSMLARGLTTIEGVISALSPETNIMSISASHIAGNMFRNTDFKKELENSVGAIYESGKKALNIPALLADALKMLMKGQCKVKMELHSSDEFGAVAGRLLNRLVGGIMAAALLLSSSLICTTDMRPKLFGIPALGVLGYFAALLLSIWIFVDIGKKK